MEKKPSDTTYFNLAGIIPVAGQPLDFELPWHDSMMPIAPNYLAVEKSAYECALAGCESIWIVCHREMQTLIRHRLGDWISDPQTMPAIKSHFVSNASEHVKHVPIYYVPIHPKDRDKRDCLSWSVVYGALRAFSVSKKISKWTVPDRYYVSFPYGAYELNVIRENRRRISNKEPFYLAHDGMTVGDGEYLPFTFDAEDWKEFRRTIRGGTGKYAPGAYYDTEENTVKAELLPVEERYSAKEYTLKEVFGSLDIQEDCKIETSQYYNIGSWEGYTQYLSSDFSKSLKRPDYILKYREYNPFGADQEEIQGSSEESS